MNHRQSSSFGGRRIMDSSEQTDTRKTAEQPEMAAYRNTTTSSSTSWNGSFYDHAKLQGKNCGAEMLIRRNGTGDSQDCCINIYINNNIQGVNNSVLVGSKVNMGDPGVALSSQDLKLGSRAEHERRTRARRRRDLSWSTRIGSLGSIVVVLLLILFFLSLPISFAG